MGRRKRSVLALGQSWLLEIMFPHICRRNRKRLMPPNLVMGPTLDGPFAPTPASLVLSFPPKLIGLRQDSSTALSIITLLNKLAQKGMIVVCSIHPPRSHIFSEFDKVLLLNKGKTVYYGGRSSIVKYFHSLGRRFF